MVPAEAGELLHGQLSTWIAPEMRWGGVYIVCGDATITEARHLSWEKQLNHEEHEVHEEKQCVETASSFTLRVIADTCCICLNFFVFFACFVV